MNEQRREVNRTRRRRLTGGGSDNTIDTFSDDLAHAYSRATQSRTNPNPTLTDLRYFVALAFLCMDPHSTVIRNVEIIIGDNADDDNWPIDFGENRRHHKDWRTFICKVDAVWLWQSQRSPTKDRSKFVVLPHMFTNAINDLVKRRIEDRRRFDGDDGVHRKRFYLFSTNKEGTPQSNAASISFFKKALKKNGAPYNWTRAFLQKHAERTNRSKLLSCNEIGVIS